MQERNPFGYAGYGLGRLEGSGDVAASIGGVGNEKIEAEAPGAGLNEGPNELRAHSADDPAATLYVRAVVVQAGYDGTIWFGILEAPLNHARDDVAWALALTLRNARKTGDGGLAALASTGPGPDDAVSPALDVVHLANIHVVAAPSVEAIAAWLSAPDFTFPKDDPALRRAYANTVGFGRRL